MQFDICSDCGDPTGSILAAAALFMLVTALPLIPLIFWWLRRRRKQLTLGLGPDPGVSSRR